MIYKLSDGTRVRTRHFGDDAGTVEFERYRYLPVKEEISVTYLDGEEASEHISTLRMLDAIRFGEQYGGGLGVLAHTGRPASAVAVGALLATVAAAGFVLAPDAQAPESPLSAFTSVPVVTPTPVAPSPYKPEPRSSTSTSRGGERETLAPRPRATLQKQSKAPETKHPIPTPPADVRISFYRDCGASFQSCIDGGALTQYEGNILAGHNYMGYQWLSRVPVGRTVRVISGPLAGTYKVYGHLTIGRQGGSIPAFAGSPDLVLQTCEGSGTGFSLLRRVAA